MRIQNSSLGKCRRLLEIMDAQPPFEFDQPYTLLWRTLTMRSSYLLVAVVALTLSLGSWSYGQNETPDGATSGQPQPERPNRPGRAIRCH